MMTLEWLAGLSYHPQSMSPCGLNYSAVNTIITNANPFQRLVDCPLLFPHFRLGGNSCVDSDKRLGPACGTVFALGAEETPSIRSWNNQRNCCSTNTSFSPSCSPWLIAPRRFIIIIIIFYSHQRTTPLPPMCLPGQLRVLFTHGPTKTSRLFENFLDYIIWLKQEVRLLCRWLVG